MWHMAIAGQHGVDTQLGYGKVSEDFLDPASGQKTVGDEIRLAADAQALRRGLSQHIAVVGVEAATDGEVFKRVINHELPDLAIAGVGIAKADMVCQICRFFRSTVATLPFEVQRRAATSADPCLRQQVEEVARAS